MPHPRGVTDASETLRRDQLRQAVSMITGIPAHRAAAVAAALVLLLACSSGAHAQIVSDADTPEAVYGTACAACHGPDGRGRPESVVGFDVPLPDFTECTFTSREPAADWFAIAHQGGPVRAFDRRMPAFGRVLTAPQIERAVGHLKGFCTDGAWPPGELNLPRPLMTEKAYPEDEAVLTTTLDSGAVINEFLYERRIGARLQYEVKVPLAVREGPDGWHRGLGDVAVALKRVLHHSLERGRIVSAAAEIVLPTGKESEGLGRGVTVVEPFVAFGQILPRDAFVHAQFGAEVPFDRDLASDELFWRGAIGRSFVQGEFGRTWSPMIEVLAAREIEDGAAVVWDAVPQMQVTLNRRQHVMFSAGVRLPINQRTGRDTQVLAYVLWDWFDGGLFDGW
jgi:hypothetical protein